MAAEENDRPKLPIPETTKGGHPRHPLYVKGDTTRVTFGGAR